MTTKSDAAGISGHRFRRSAAPNRDLFASRRYAAWFGSHHLPDTGKPLVALWRRMKKRWK